MDIGINLRYEKAWCASGLSASCSHGRILKEGPELKLLDPQYPQRIPLNHVRIAQLHLVKLEGAVPRKEAYSSFASPSDYTSKSTRRPTR